MRLVSVLSVLLLCVTKVEGQQATAIPLQFNRISSGFGPRINPITGVFQLHSGIDIPAGIGTKVRSIGPGVVVFAGKFGRFGNLVTVVHGRELASLYGHLQEIHVHVGELLVGGKILGTVGSTGQVTGPHLHLELRRKNRPLNPTGFLEAINAKVVSNQSVILNRRAS